MTYFKSVTNLDDLKAQFRALALEHHPDMGGDTETMKAINNEFDRLFPIWQARTASKTSETADSTRREFYTQNGWAGENYQSGRSLKEIAEIIRAYCKEVYSAYRFSVTTHYASMCQALTVALMEAPHEAFKEPGKGHAQLNQYSIDREKELTDETRAIFADLVRLINSYRMDDSDGMIDYFCTNFYYHIAIGRWDKPFQVVPREPKKPDSRQYETVTVRETRTRKVIEVFPIETPQALRAGLHFRLKVSFSGGACRGFVYEISDLERLGGEFLEAYKMDRKLKSVCKGDVRGNRFFTGVQKFRQWVEQGAIEFVELREVTETYEAEKTVKRLVKPETKLEGYKAEERPEAKPEPGAIPTDYTVTPDTDTRDGTQIWVVKFTVRMDHETYKATAAALKAMKGYYSKFKRGFLFRYDPTEALAVLAGRPAPEAPQPNAPEPIDDSKETAEEIEDASTDIIRDLRLRPGEYRYSAKYRDRLEAFLDTLGDRFHERTIAQIEFQELQDLLRGIFEKRKAAAAA